MAPPLIMHVVHRFAVGGMENGVVNLINRLPEDFARHCVLALTEVDAAFAARIRRRDTGFVALGKPPGQTARILPGVYRLLRRLRPAAVHTRNVGTIEVQAAAALARIPVRVHGEHGWDVGDLDGSNRRMLWLRRAMRPFIHHQIALSAPTHRYLVRRVGVPESRVTDICNGVDTNAFRPPADRAATRAALAARDPGAARILAADAFAVGAVGRLAAVKNPSLLLAAFASLRERDPQFARRARLALIGDGPLAREIRAQVAALGLADVTWLAGERDDVPACLQALDLLCLPSLAEGISNVVLEAMSCGVPVVATDVGGNRELIDDGVTGALVPSGDADALAAGIERYFTDAAIARRAGVAARERAVTEFSLDTMIAKYHRVYLEQFARAGIVERRGAHAARPAGNA